MESAAQRSCLEVALNGACGVFLAGLVASSWYWGSAQSSVQRTGSASHAAASQSRSAALLLANSGRRSASGLDTMQEVQVALTLLVAGIVCLVLVALACRACQRVNAGKVPPQHDDPSHPQPLQTRLRDNGLYFAAAPAVSAPDLPLPRTQLPELPAPAVDLVLRFSQLPELCACACLDRAWHAGAVPVLGRRLSVPQGKACAVCVTLERLPCRECVAAAVAVHLSLQRCTRCQEAFCPSNPSPCRWHPGICTAIRSFPVELAWSCCGCPGQAPGCIVAQQHTSHSPGEAWGSGVVPGVADFSAEEVGWSSQQASQRTATGTFQHTPPDVR